MNPQCGYYQPKPNCCVQGYKPGPISQGRFSSSTRIQAGGGGRAGAPTYGYNPRQSSTARAPPTFPSRVQSSGNFYGNQPNGNQQQQRCNMPRGSGSRMQMQQQQQPQQQQRMQNYMPSRTSYVNYKAPYRQQQFECEPAKLQHPLAPAPYCTPQAIKVNVTAEQLESAKNVPIYPDRSEASQEDNPNVKYVALNWNDLLGGMENLRVSMVPSADPNCQNNQLKVSFGGQKTDPPQAGETSLKVVSIEPVNTGRMDITQGNAYAGHMKICNNPTNLRMAPTNNGQQRQQQSNYSRGGGGNGNYQYQQQNRGGNYGGVTCRR